MSLSYLSDIEMAENSSNEFFNSAPIGEQVGMNADDTKDSMANIETISKQRLTSSYYRFILSPTGGLF